MLGTVFRFELRYHATRPVTYLYLAFFFLLSFSFVASDAVTIGGGTGQVMRNAPWVIAQVMLVLVAVGQVVVTGLVGTAVLRDYQFRVHELLFTTPLTKFAYLGGRFLGAFVVMIVVHLGIPLGMIAGSMMPWVDQTRVLPLDLAAYALPFLVLVIPSVLLLSAIFFAVGALTRNLFAIYTQGIFLLVAWSVAGQLFSDVEYRDIAAVMEPFALQAFALLTRYWTVAEKNTLSVPLAGPLLQNRLLWTGLALVVVAGTLALFRFRSAPPSPRFLRRRAAPVETAPAPATVSLVQPARDYGRLAWWRQVLSTARLSFWSIVRQVPFLAIVTIGIVNLVMGAAFADALYGQKVWPVTYTMAEMLQDQFLLFFIILITIYAGEAVWRERQMDLDQITDTLPARTSVPLAGKFGGLLAVELLLLAILFVTGIAAQTAKGYYNYEVGLYLKFLLGTTLPTLIQITVLAMMVHVLVNQKYVGHVIMIVFWIGSVTLGSVGLDHQLFAFAETPPFTYSDMNGFGPFVPNLVLSALYWTGVAGVFAVVAFLFWIRGTDDRWKARRALARERWRGPVRWAAALSLLLAVAAGGTIFYNTNVLNTYRSSKASRQLQARYERTYKHLEDLTMPRLVDADVRADLEPEIQAFTVSGTLTYINDQSRSLDSVVVTISHEEMAVDTLAWSRPATVVLADSAFGTTLYRFEPALAPGDTVRLRYRARFEQHGFGNDGPTTSVVANGTFINSEYFPVLGYQSTLELASDDARRKEKLEPKERMASLDDEAARSDTYLGAGAAWIGFRATVSTAPDQIAIAPGYLEREYMENGRRVFEYAMDTPMMAFFAFLSARYEVRREEWKGIRLEIYYHPGHEYNLDRMMESMKASLDYFGEHFSPYQFRQLRILEFPRYAQFAQAFPNTVPYSESIGFILRDTGDDDDLDMPHYVTAHEVGHQWWAHQVIGANVQGSTLFSEGLANYSAITVMEKRHGADHLRKFLVNELDRYLAGRATEAKKELPLLLVENQGYIHYNKGSLALYALRDYIGEEAMNRALSRFVADKAFQPPPYTTSREFLGYLDAETPDSLRYVVDDLFRTITLWDNGAETVTSTARGDGRYDVAITIRARKFRADSTGEQEEIPVADLVDVGVFGEREPGNKLGKPLYLQKHWIRTRDTTLTVTVDQVPARAGIDPYNKLIDRDPVDNVRELPR